MLFSNPAIFVALFTGLRPVLAHESPFSPRSLFKRIASPHESWVDTVDWKHLLDWNKKEIYTGIDWAAHPEWYKPDNGGPDSEQPPAPPPPPAPKDDVKPVVEDNVVQNPPQSQSAQPQPSQSASVGSPAGQSFAQQGGRHHGGDHSKGSGKCGTTSAQCPPGCAMTVKFTSDSLAVPFTAGAQGQSDSKQTKDSCICMNPGSVRINVGTTDTATHGTLIEGNAAGLNDNSFFDVSYVEGYNYPVVCWNEQDPSRMSGSNVDLYAQGSCSSSGASKMGDVCVNDGYTKLTSGGAECYKCSLPSVFFGPAAGAAYTYPYDDCPCASDHQDGMPYQSPMANGGALMCCVGPQCCANTMTHGGMTKKGNCNRPDCQPCQLGFSWGHCSSACQPGKDKRSYERVLQQHSLRKRQSAPHHHHHGHNR